MGATVCKNKQQQQATQVNEGTSGSLSFMDNHPCLEPHSACSSNMADPQAPQAIEPQAQMTPGLPEDEVLNYTKAHHNQPLPAL